MSNTNNLKLKLEMLSRGITARDLADMIGINYSTVLRKLNGGRQFTVEEARRIKLGLHLSTARTAEIFFHDSP